ncbi:MAG TPA: magnesium transporter [Vitreimonas sp.]|uniref:magnesium transporter n=1 Tax=Vitreimonas sp. TaxID=3069702 RepID=UPI002D3847C9|nr:magnesium transporter [Vitreimonas sp.]HYD87964.1 magnesium transporter [Vitreimonas sp.]
MSTETEPAAAEQTRRPPSEDPHFIASVVGAAGDHDAPLLRRLLAGLDTPDLADVIEHVPLETALTIARLIGRELPVELLADLSWERREQVLPELPPEFVGKALGELDTDDAAAVAADIDEKQLGQVLAAADEDTRLAVEEALSFEEETAGRLMQREYVAAPEGDRVGDVIDRMRADSAELPDEFFEIYVVDAAMRPIGAVRVSSLIRSRRETPLLDIMRSPLILIRPEMDQEEVAQTFQKYHMASAPVVDEAGRLTGMVTVDDIVDVISEESEEDLLRLAGVSEAAQTDSVLRSVRARAPWLLVNLGTAVIASWVISRFEGSIDQLVALAVLMPIVASMGGNAGTQALAVAVRAIAARDLTEGNAGRYVVRETMTAVSNGFIFALVLAAVVAIWFQNGLLAWAIALAILINFACAGLAGILVPLTLRRLGADPAVSSSVFVTFVTDIVGFLAFLGLATLILLS